MTGVVKKLAIDKGFGFIRGEDNREYFFHRSAVDRSSSTPFEMMEEERTRVEFEPGTSEKGPRATDVCPI